MSNFEKWIEALRSGKYRQGRKALRTEDGDYCCLGVGCMVAGKEVEVVWDHAALPPFDFAVWLGVVDSESVDYWFNTEDKVDLIVDWPRDLDFGDDEVSTMSCSWLNDEANLTFDQIADMLEYFGVREIEAS